MKETQPTAPLPGSIQYYDTHAEDFYNRTIGIPLDSIHKKFLDRLPVKARVLDAGCGVGRDARGFKEAGCAVVAFDAAPRMVHFASLELGEPALLHTFADMPYVQEFDGVWSNAALMHVPFEETRGIMEKIHRALKAGGLFYASYKYGTGEEVKGERILYNMTEQTIQPYLKGLFTEIEVVKVPDLRASFPDQAWLHLFCRKV